MQINELPLPGRFISPFAEVGLNVSIQFSSNTNWQRRLNLGIDLIDPQGGRGGQIRTDDFLLPKQALYQAELRPVVDGARYWPRMEWIATRKLQFLFNLC